MNDTLKTILIALIILCIYHNYGKEGFDYRRYNVLEGYNNMVLTNPNGDLSSIAFPSGIVMIWTKGIDSIPNGWALCDGTRGTPDLSGKFVLGVNPNSDKMEFRIVGRGGGSSKISVGQLPAHTHQYGTNKYLGPNGGSPAPGPPQNQDRNWNRDWQGDTTSTGEGKDYYPPFVTLAYIMKL